MTSMLGLIIQSLELAVLIFGGFKIYYVLYEHPPHSHEERGDDEILRTSGIRYPRGTKR